MLLLFLFEKKTCLGCKIYLMIAVWSANYGKNHNNNSKIKILSYLFANISYMLLLLSVFGTNNKNICTNRECSIGKDYYCLRLVVSEYIRTFYILRLCQLFVFALHSCAIAVTYKPCCMENLKKIFLFLIEIRRINLQISSIFEENRPRVRR